MGREFFCMFQREEKKNRSKVKFRIKMEKEEKMKFR